MIDYDATLFERLRDAGAVFVAKLQWAALAQGPSGSAALPAIPGRLMRPSRSSGSSAGPASATSAGLVGVFDWY